MKAIEISGQHLGKRVRSVRYSSKNKTARPWPEPSEYEIKAIYMHLNGTILINSSIYLRPDTDVTVLN